MRYRSAGSRPPIRVWFFAGPTISAAELSAACSKLGVAASIKPPIQQGDLLSLGDEPPDVIAVIDGYFFQLPSVTHKEILLALERGIWVLGSASLGALRAAELDEFGMEGVGDIYRLYKRGVLDADDEVAVLHAEAAEGFRPLTEALVNIRHNLRRALDRRMISASTAAAVLAGGRRLHFTLRTYRAVLNAARDEVPKEELAALWEFIQQDGVDLKRKDAFALVNRVSELARRGDPFRKNPSFQTHETVYLHLYKRQYLAHRLAPAEEVSEAMVFSAWKLFSPTFPSLLRQVVSRCICVEEAFCRGLSSIGGTLLLDQFRHRRRLTSEAAYRRWLHGRFMSEEELKLCLEHRFLEVAVLDLYAELCPETTRREALRRRILSEVASRTGVAKQVLTRPLFMRPGVPWEAPALREIKWRGEFGAALNLTNDLLRSHREFSDAVPGFSESLAPERLERWFGQRWGVGSTGFEAALLDRGFTSYREFIDIARMAYGYDRMRSDVNGSVAPNEPMG